MTSEERAEGAMQTTNETRRDPSPRMTDVRELARREGPMLSLLIPVTAAVPAVSQNRVRHEHVVSEALARWRELGGDPKQVARARGDLEHLTTKPEAPPNRVATRAVFWSADRGMQAFGLPFRLADTARIANCALIRPLVLAARRPGRYRVLSLSARHVVLYEGDEYTLERVESADLPTSLEAALGSDLTNASLQFHTSGRRGAPVYHGQGGAARAREVDLDRFHRVVARGLESEVATERLPLVLASDARHRPGLERALRRDVGLLPKQLEGNADHLSPSALHAAAWPIVADSIETCPAAWDRGHGPMHHLSKIVSHAVMGRIRRLWVPEFGAIPASLDRSSGRATDAWGDDDLIELLCAEVLRHQGAVEILTGATFSTKARGLEAELR